MTNIFISGGLGFVGSALVRKLLASQQVGKVLVYDNCSSGRIENLNGITDGRLHIVCADIEDRETLADSLRGSDTIFHLVANPDISKGSLSPDLDFVKGTVLCRNVLEEARRSPVKNFFYASGSGVYGDHPGTVFREDHGPLLPISPYAASKLACEALICAYSHMFGIRARVCRFANLVGPRQTHGIGFDFVQRLSKNPSVLKVLGNGSQSKSYVFIDDAIDAILLVMGHGDALYDVFNVANNDSLTVGEIAEMAVDIFSTPSCKIEFGEGDRGWNGDVPSVQFDCSKARALGWSPYFSTSRHAMDFALRTLKEE